MADVHDPDVLNRAELAKLPTFSGDRKTDTFIAEHWLARVDNTRASANWDDARTMTYVFNALRGKAVLWYFSLERSDVDVTVYDQFKAAFLEAYSTVRTVRSTTVTLTDLSQGPAESIVDFYARVVKAVKDVEAMIPNGAFNIPAAPWMDEVTAVAQFVALPVDIRARQAQLLVNHGARAMASHMGLNLFCSNIRAALREDLLKQAPATMYAAFQAAQEIEKIKSEARPSTTVPAMPVATSPAVSASVDTEESILAELDDLESLTQPRIDALQKKLKTFRNNRQTNNQQSGNRTNNNQNNNRGNNAPSGSSSNNNSNNRNRSNANRNNPNAKNVVCRYCNIKGHFQYDCRSRLRDAAPMTDANGRPYTKMPAHPIDSAPPHGQVVYSPYYGQMQYLQTPPGYPPAPQMSDFQ